MREMRNAYSIFLGKFQGNMPLGNLVLDGRIILK